MATFNGGRWLRAQLDSIYAQQDVRLDVVVTDDGSTDDTIAILQEFSDRHGLRFYRNGERLGYRENFAAAIRACSSDLIALADQDDIWESRKLATLAAAIGDDLLVHSDVVVVNGEGHLVAPSCRRRDFGEMFDKVFLDRDYHRASLLTRNSLAQGCTMLIRKELLATALPFPANEPDHDIWFAFVAAAHRRVHFVDHAGVRWRIHGSNSSQGRQWSSWRRLIEGGIANALHRRVKFYKRARLLRLRGVNPGPYPLPYRKELF